MERTLNVLEAHNKKGFQGSKLETFIFMNFHEFSLIFINFH